MATFRFAIPSYKSYSPEGVPLLSIHGIRNCLLYQLSSDAMDHVVIIAGYYVKSMSLYVHILCVFVEASNSSQMYSSSLSVVVGICNTFSIVIKPLVILSFQVKEIALQFIRLLEI